MMLGRPPRQPPSVDAVRQRLLAAERAAERAQAMRELVFRELAKVELYIIRRHRA